MRVAGVYRYPIKSLGGEALQEASVHSRGLAGDRVLALYDVESGAVVSGKNPRRWPRLGDLFASHSRDGVLIRLQGGELLQAEGAGAEERLSQVLGRRVSILSEPPEGAIIHRLWPDVSDIAPAHVRAQAVAVDGPDVTAGPLALLAPGTFFDAAPVHVVFAASLRHLAALSRADADPIRFRPNIVIEGGDDGCFAEDALLGHELSIGPDVILRFDLPTPRCIVPTLPTGSLPENKALLRSLAAHHRMEVGGLGSFACFGVYASVARAGVIRLDDRVEVRAPA